MANGEKGYSVETCIQIWDDATGERIEIGPDRDSGELLEIRQVEPKGEIRNRVALPVELALLMAKAIIGHPMVRIPE